MTLTNKKTIAFLLALTLVLEGQGSLLWAAERRREAAPVLSSEDNLGGSTRPSRPATVTRDYTAELNKIKKKLEGARQRLACLEEGVRKYPKSWLDCNGSWLMSSRDAQIKNLREEIARLEREISQSTGESGSDNTSDSYYDREAGRWRSRSFDRHWRELQIGSSAHQAQMRNRGYIWDEEQAAWLDVRDLERARQQRMSTLFYNQAIMRSMDLPPEQQEVVERIARDLLNGSEEPAQRAARMQRLRNGTHLMASAATDRELAYVADMDQTLAVADPIAKVGDVGSMLLPGLSDVRDVVEVLSGRDALTGNELSWWEIGLTGIGIIIGSGAAYRQMIRGGSKMADAGKTLQRITEASGAERRMMQDALETTTNPQLMKQALQDIPKAERRIEGFKKAVQQGHRRVDQFEKAIRSGNKSKIKKAMLELQGDWQAITAINRRSDVLKKAFNENLGKFYKEVDGRVRRKIAKKLGIDPKHVTIFSASNPSAKIKVGKDRDFTLRIFGKDMPSSEASRLYNKELFDVAKKHGGLPSGVRNPSELGRKLDQTSVHWLDAEAYNKADLDKVLLQLPDRLTDPSQIGKTIAHKGLEHFSHAKDIARKGDWAKAERSWAEGMYQLTKQYRNQFLPRLDLYGHVSDPALKAFKFKKLNTAVEVMKKVELGKISPVEAQAALRRMGLTPEQVAHDLGKAVESLDVLSVARPFANAPL